MRRRINGNVIWLGLALSISGSSTVHSEKIVSVIDLSHKPHLKATTLCNAIQDVVWKAPDQPNEIELDVSFSELGNEGLYAVLQSLKAPDRERILVRLTARFNRLTPEGVSRMLTSLLESEKEKKVDDGALEATVGSTASPLSLHSLDIGWNNLNPEQVGNNAFLLSIRKILEHPEQCPKILRLDRCGLGPAACRALGKGIMTRLEHGKTVPVADPLSLYLCGNDAVGDAGIAALAAAIRSAVSGEEPQVVFDVLDLSSCDISDAGAEAFALALETFPGCVRHLDLSNNRISNEGAAAIGRALMLSTSDAHQGGVLERLDLSHNPDLGDSGATALAGALERGIVKHVSLRSCQVGANGAQAFGMALQNLSSRQYQNGSYPVSEVTVDLSGNPLGILRGKSKSGGKYSASAFKSKASATTASYMSFLGKTIRNGLKDAGLDVSGMMGGTVESGESDDEEEALMGNNNDNTPEKSDASKARCGAKAFASAIVKGEHNVEDMEEKISPKAITIKCHLELRRCFLDQGAADALAATVLQAKDRLGIELTIDARMNPVLEDEMVEALAGSFTDPLEEMSERHMATLEILRIAELRAAEAAAARMREEATWEEEEDGDEGGDFGFDDIGDDVGNEYDQYDDDY